MSQFKNFMEMLTKIQVNIPFCESLKKMPIYAKFMKDLLLGKRKLKHDENISLAEECSAIIQKKLPPKLSDPGRFTIPCAIDSLTINHALCDLRDNINLMHLSMGRQLKYGEPKPTQMRLTLEDHSIMYPYGVLKYVLVRVDGLLFLANFAIPYMFKGSENHYCQVDHSWKHVKF